MTKRIRVNVRTTVNTKKARKTRRNGRDVIILPSATLPDDIIMNNIKYPADEIEASYKSLERSPAPFGHPMTNQGKFLSALDPEGINVGWVGAWNENVRREKGRVLLDKVVDIDVANRSDEGKELLNAIEEGEPIHTSTGLYCNLDDPDADDHEHVARDIVFDHDAILLHEEGAGTPEQGVGIFVNSSGDREEIDVVNSYLEDSIEDQLDWAGMELLGALERRERASAWEQLKSAIMGLLSGSTERETSTNKQENEMAVSEEQFQALSDKVDTLSDSLVNISDTIATAIAGAVSDAVKPIANHVEQIENAQKEEAEAKRTAAVNKLVESGAWTEEELTDVPMTALNKLVDGLTTGKAKNFNKADPDASDDEFANYNMNSALEAAMKEAH